MIKSSRTVRRIVAASMLAALAVAVVYDPSQPSETGIARVQALAEELRSLGRPFLLYSVSSLLGVVACVVGGALHFFGVALSQRVLLAGALFTVLSYPMVSIYVDSSVAYAASFIFAACLGWLIATPPNMAPK